MRIEAVMFATRAAVDNSLLAIEGGGWEHYRVVIFPATVSGYVAGVLALDEDEHGDLHSVSLDVLDDSGQVEGFRASMIAVGTRPETQAGVPYRVAFAIPFMTVANGPTVIKARLSDTQGTLGELTCAITGGAPDALPEDFGA